MADGAASALTLAARTALAEWGLDGARLSLIGQVENTVFRVDARGAVRYVLRIHRPGYHSLAELESEQLWTAALNAAGVGVPRARPTLDGRRYASVAVGAEPTARFVGVSEWFEGEAMSTLVERAPDPQTVCELFHRLGALAARIHDQAAAWQVPAHFNRHALDADGLMGERPWWGQFWRGPALSSSARTHVLALRAALYERLRTLDTGPTQFSLIHADLHPGNLLVHGQQVQIIDFDDAGFGWHVFELAVVLFRHRHADHYPLLRDALIGGYRTQRALSAQSVALLPVFFAVRALALVGWVHGRPELGLEARARALVDELLTLNPGDFAKPA